MVGRRLITALCSFAMVMLLVFSLAHQVSSSDDQKKVDNGNQYATQVNIGGTNRKLLPLQSSCESLCEVRCSLHSRPNLCKRACGTCCYRCKCVPPGTYGNREMCGKCYTDMKTHGNKNKCP
ncbi:gibberellin-regulated protein 1-like [Impatiens glandulifera]|uniref:gibberellin-regulated protein 1-like n=1 Tax=Impatiens glandulifera TaxID=253017 RepID=UPI001FB0764D|nr:gibberellin-regulated protein 1-like [Impatiens glandulifera]